MRPKAGNAAVVAAAGVVVAVVGDGDEDGDGAEAEARVEGRAGTVRRGAQPHHAVGTAAGTAAVAALCTTEHKAEAEVEVEVEAEAEAEAEAGAGAGTGAGTRTRVAAVTVILPLLPRGVSADVLIAVSARIMLIMACTSRDTTKTRR